MTRLRLIVLMISLGALGGFVLGSLWQADTLQHIGNESTEDSVPYESLEPRKSPMQSTPNELASLRQSEPIVREYLQSGFRVLKLVRPSTEYDINNTWLVVATTRSSVDESCGSVVPDGACYFFLERRFADIEPVVFVAKWYGGYSLLESAEFVDSDVILFTSLASRHEERVRTHWSLNLTTGEITKTFHEDA
jgi:hypothetical protein